MQLAIAVLSEPAPISIGRLSQTRYGYILNCNSLCPINQGGQSDRVYTQIVLPVCSQCYFDSLSSS